MSSLPIEKTQDKYLLIHVIFMSKGVERAFSKQRYIKLRVVVVLTQWLGLYIIIEASKDGI